MLGLSLADAQIALGVQDLPSKWYVVTGSHGFAMIRSQQSAESLDANGTMTETIRQHALWIDLEVCSVHRDFCMELRRVLIYAAREILRGVKTITWRFRRHRVTRRSAATAVFESPRGRPTIASSYWPMSYATRPNFSSTAGHCPLPLQYGPHARTADRRTVSCELLHPPIKLPHRIGHSLFHVPQDHRFGIWGQASGAGEPALATTNSAFSPSGHQHEV